MEKSWCRFKSGFFPADPRTALPARQRLPIAQPANPTRSVPGLLVFQSVVELRIIFFGKYIRTHHQLLGQSPSKTALQKRTKLWALRVPGAMPGAGGTALTRAARGSAILTPPRGSGSLTLLLSVACTALPSPAGLSSVVDMLYTSQAHPDVGHRTRLSHFILINLHINRHVWLVATVLDSADLEDGLSEASLLPPTVPPPVYPHPWVLLCPLSPRLCLSTQLVAPLTQQGSLSTLPVDLPSSTFSARPSSPSPVLQPLFPLPHPGPPL